ncbi:MAG TPA: zf-HC2 domain-containing protein [Actinomycetota bacterium]|nr:zf-HC2 domain-containing protein [Actinomycetota bacterium]
MQCTSVRDELGEHMLGTLDPDRRAEVDRHLAACAGCRKEAGELAEGAALVGMAAAADPPADLGDRVVEAVRRASARSRRPRGTRAAVAIAAAVALAAGGLAVAMAGRVERLQDEASTARTEAERSASAFQEVLEEVGGQTPILAAPLDGAGEGGGRALLFDAVRGRDFVVVIVGGLPPSGAPYRAYLVSPGERRLTVGRLSSEAPGQLSRTRLFRDLSGYGDLVVVDRAGQTVLSGRFAVSS